MVLLNWLAGWMTRSQTRRHRSLGQSVSNGSRRTRQPFAAEALESRWLLSTITVNTTADEIIDDGAVSLREAIQAANTDTTVDGATGSGADTIEFYPGLFSSGNVSIDLSLVGDSTVGSSALSITSEITIQGPTGSNGLTIARAGGASEMRLFLVSNSGNLTLSDLTITGGTEFDGGGIFNAGVLTLNESILTGNFAENEGGGLYNSGTLMVTASTISGNTAGEVGGGIANDNDGTATVMQSTISGNTARYDGYGYGYNYGSGGGIGNSGTLTVTKSTISGNSAGEEGGGIGNEGSLTVIASTISGNSAGFNAGGIGNSYYGTATVIQSTISGNSAGSSGGGIGNDGALTVGQSTITGNSAGFSGGGGLVGRYGSVTLTNSIVAGNTASGAASDIADFGHYYEDGSYVGFNLSVNTTNSVNNLIGDANTAGGLPDKSIDSPHGNIVGMSGSGTLDINTVLFPVLVANGGPTLTHPLMLDSLALDAGAALTTLSSNITDSDLVISVSDAALIPVGTLIQIEDEILLVNSKTGNTLGVTRGQSSTTAAANLTGASVQFAFDQRGSGFPRILNSTVDIGAVEGTASETFVAVTVSPTSVFEGQESDGANLVFQFVRSDKGVALTVDFDVSGTASLNDDYTVPIADSFTSTSGSVTFAAGSTSATVTVNPTQDLLIEFHETVVLTLLGDADYDLSSATVATGTIAMDEPLIVDTLSDLDDNDFEADNDFAGDGFSLREAIRVASMLGDSRSISFASSLFSGGAKTLGLSSGELVITKSMHIVGPGADLLTIDANGLSRIFHVDGDLDNDGQADFNGGGFSGLFVSMSDLTLTGGGATDGGAIWNEFGHVVISHSVLSDNTATGRGGAIFTQANGGEGGMPSTLLLDDVTLSGNSAENGGGIYNLNDHVEITDSLIDDNTATQDGGGIYTSFVGNDSVEGGGGLDGGGLVGGGLVGGGGDIGGGPATLFLFGTSVTNNHATNGDGGGIYSDHDYVRFNESEVSGNTSGGNGGGIYLDGNTLSILDSTVADNLARNGGGIYIENTSSEDGYAYLTITGGSEIRDNQAIALPGQSAQGGGIFSRASGAYLFDTTISGNEVKGGDATEESAAGFAEGGGIYQAQTDYGYFSMNDNDISDNHATGGHALGVGSGGNGFGGGFYTNGYLTAFDNTFSNNSATGGDGTAPGNGQGGGLWISGGSGTYLGTTTFSGNQATGGNNTDPELNGGNGSGGGLFSMINLSNLSVGISTFSNNSASGGQGASLGVGNGGGIWSGAGFLGLFEVTMNGNEATQDGGGLFTTSSASIDDSTLWDNSAVNGGGIWNSGLLYVLQLTLSGNRATNDGGGLHNSGIEDSSINSSTITDNHADSDNDGIGTGGGVWHRTDFETTVILIEDVEYEFTESGSLEVHSSIIAGNFQGTDIDLENSNDDPVSNDFVQDEVVVSGIYGSFIGGDPELGPLQDNGGTTLTHEPGTDSPVVDPVDGTFSDFGATDQRGRARVVGATQDFGSVEVQQLQDYGDAPMLFGTVQTFYYYGAASHSVGSGDSLRLGELIDVEDDGQPNALALGDDQNPNEPDIDDDDEDGVTFTSAMIVDGKPNLVVGTTVTVTVIATNVDPDHPAYLNAWIDFNGDGYFQDYYGSEQIFNNVNVTLPGVDLSEEEEGIQLSFVVPGSAGTNPTTYARFRLSTQADLLSYGTARDGEVEDYVVSTSGISAHVDDTAPESEGGWNIQVAPVAGDFSFAGGLFSWNRDFSTDEDNPNHMAQQWFWYRIGETGPELGLDSLTLISANSHATNSELGANTIELLFGSPDTDDIEANDPIQVKVTYVLSGSDAAQSTITETVEITNLGDEALELHWFEFTDLDVDGERYDNTIVSAGLTGITQSGPLGSEVTVAVTNGPTPDRFQVEDFRTYGPTGRYGNTRLGMIDYATTNLTNVAPASSVLGDFVQAFQWDFSSSDVGTNNSALAAGQTTTITKTKSGEFVQVALGDSTTTEGGTVFNDPAPSTFVPKWYDPAIAIGYDYVVTGTQNFAGLALPVGFTDSLYTLHLPNGDGFNETPDATLRGGDIDGDFDKDENDVYNFITGFTVDANGYLAASGTTIPGVPGGRTSIRILGIEADANVDPANPVGFPTGFTFIGSGNAEFTQTGIAETIYVDQAADFSVTAEGTNVGNATGLDAGDTVTWFGSAGDADDVTGLIFGATAFSSVPDAVNAVVYSGTKIQLAPGTFTGAITADRDLTLIGDGAVLQGASRVLHVMSGQIVTLDGVTITGGSEVNGGGVLNEGTLTITNSTLSNNTATGDGGAIYNAAGATLTLTNVTISGNSAANEGGGIFAWGTVTITHSTITKNRADSDGTDGGDGGGIYVEDGSSPLLHHTIVAGNINGNGAEENDVGVGIAVPTFNAASSYNLFGTGSGGLVGGVQGNQVSVDPLLDPLADNGGPTQTHKLLTGSPAIDAGNASVSGAPATDQRGAARIADGDSNSTAVIDIGAFELNNDFDFGDAPDGGVGVGTNTGNYQTKLARGGAVHAASGPRLGATRDFEADGQQSADATGDDTAGSPPDDEDGVTFVTTLLRHDTAVITSSVVVNVGLFSGKLDAWIDFNQDGDWIDAGEQIFDNQVVGVGDNVLSFSIPAGATAGTTFARFRLSTAGVALPTGLAVDGEVEDYEVTLMSGNPDVGIALPPAGGTVEVLLSGTDFVVQRDGVELLRTPAGGIASLTLNGTAGVDDVLLLNAAIGNPIPINGLAFNGGAAGNDALRITGTALTATYTPDTTTFGNGTITVGSGNLGFTGLEPIEFNVGGGTFNLNLTGVNDVVDISESTLLDETTPALKIFGSTGALNFENARVRGSAIVINTTSGGSDGDDTVTITNANNAHANTSLSINTGTGTDSVDIDGAATFSGTVSITTESIDIGAVLSGSSITLQPGSSGRSIGLGNDAVGDFNLTTTELTNLSSSGTVTIGASGGTGELDLRTVDLSGEAFHLTLHGGATTFNGGLTLPSGKTLTLTTGAITSPNSGTDVTIAGSSTLGVTASGAIGASAAPLTTNVATLVTDTNDSTDFAQFLSEANSVSIGAADLDAGTATITLVSGTFLTSASGFIRSPLSLAGGTLGGTGTVQGAVSMTNAGGTIAPGTSPGQLTVDGSVTLDAAGTFDVELTGTTVGTQYDQLSVTGASRTVTLNGVKLNLSFGSGPFTPATDNKFTIIDNVASTSTVSGTFKDSTGTTNLAEGSAVIVSGNHFLITYQGGTNNNDVVLTADQTPPTVAINIEDTALSDTDNASNVTFLFSEDPGTSFVLGDISVTNGAMSDLVKDDATHYHATFTADDGIEDTGSVTVNVTKFTDAALNNNVAATPDTVSFDTKNPTVAITDDEPGVAKFSGGSVIYTFTFSEVVTDFTVDEVEVENGSKAAAFATNTGMVYTLAITPTPNFEGIVTVNVADAVAVDAANNPNTAATESTQEAMTTPEFVRVRALLGVLHITDDSGLSNDITVSLDTAANPDVYVVSSPLAELSADGINGVKEIRILKSEVNVGIKAQLGDGDDSLNFDRLALSATVHGGDGEDIILAGSGNDELFGDDGDDLVRGGSGNDVVSGGSGTDVVHGDKGTDTQLEETNADSVIVNKTAIIGVGSTPDESETFGTGIEKVWIIGGIGGNKIDASLSIRPVTLSGGDGNDTLIGSSNVDSLLGGNDDDELTGNAGKDALDGGGGDDTVVEARNANFTLTNTSLIGNGTDTLSNLEIANLTGGMSSNTFTVSGWTGRGSFIGGGSTDTIVAVKNVATFTLSDTNLATSDEMELELDGFSKANLTGGSSVNVFIVSNWHGSGSINGSGGTDRIEATRNADMTLKNSSLATAGLPAFGTLSLVSVETANLSGGDAANNLSAKLFTLGAVTLQGNGGKDVLIGGSKNDVLIGGDGDDSLTGGGGRDLLIGGADKDTLNGDAGDDILIGGTSTHSDNIAALNAIMAEWASANTYATRIAKLRDTGVLLGSIKLDGSTVQNDSDVADSLTGGADRDWFFQAANDVLDAVLIGAPDKIETVTLTTTV